MPSWEQDDAERHAAKPPQTIRQDPKEQPSKGAHEPHGTQDGGRELGTEAQVSQVGHLMHRNGEDTGRNQELSHGEGPEFAGAQRLLDGPGLDRGTSGRSSSRSRRARLARHRAVRLQTNVLWTVA